MNLRHASEIAAITLLLSASAGCSTYKYVYVLEVRCQGRPIPGQPSWISTVGDAPPVKVSIQCDGQTKNVVFDPMGQTRTIRFGENYRVMIDGSAQIRGFTVRAQRDGYKEWSATYTGSLPFMFTSGGAEGGTMIRLDSVKLEPLESPVPSVRIKGGP